MQFVFPTQDPSTIEHETTASGVIYTVVDKLKRSSKKEGEPGVVPPASEGVSGGGLAGTILCSYVAVDKKILVPFPYSTYKHSMLTSVLF